ncbi:hypothetical protein HNY73_016670 [Argiope bruennichi]|uniref:Uncharacterized protein n=1 Tax=Argiope bruennichi TaxID=94029 RepID=A0A8T0EN26_ARGBR|nr:hypothetical protein HNY73_016670 [Argiope bruennichi]
MHSTSPRHTHPTLSLSSTSLSLCSERRISLLEDSPVPVTSLGRPLSPIGCVSPEWAWPFGGGASRDSPSIKDLFAGRGGQMKRTLGVSVQWLAAEQTATAGWRM